jgi:hypothetical protein
MKMIKTNKSNWKYNGNIGSHYRCLYIASVLHGWRHLQRYGQVRTCEPTRWTILLLSSGKLRLTFQFTWSTNEAECGVMYLRNSELWPKYFALYSACHRFKARIFKSWLESIYFVASDGAFVYMGLKLFYHSPEKARSYLKSEIWGSRDDVWKLLSSEIFRHVVWWKFTDISEERTAIIFRVEE